MATSDDAEKLFRRLLAIRNDLTRLQAVIRLTRVVAPQKAIDEEIALDRRQRCDEARIVAIDEADLRQQQQARIEQRGVIGRPEGVALFVEAATADVGVDLRADGAPFLDRAGKAMALHRLDGATNATQAITLE